MSKCKLRKGTGNCTFFYTETGEVTLSVEGPEGTTVLFQKAKYNGQDVAGLPGKTMRITIMPGRTELDVVYSFSDPTDGTGALKEVCEANTTLMQVSATEPSQVYYIGLEKRP